jgi:hypothetical protein
MREVYVLAAVLSAQLLLAIAPAQAQAPGGCQADYLRCQQTCKDNSIGGKNFGVGLWDASRSKACFDSCPVARRQCNLRTATKRGPFSTRNKNKF